MVRFLLPALFFVSTLLLWALFLPIQFGGLSAYVIVNGNSMEPLYHKGDLVITRREMFYQVGDIITYFNHELNTPVIHRIIATDGNTFVMRGDHNAWQDNEQPVQRDVIGKSWIHVPEVGQWLGVTQTPLGIALLSGTAIFLLLSMFISHDGVKRFRRKKQLSGERPVPISIKFSKGATSMQKLGRQIETLLLIFLALFIASLALFIISFANPETISTPANIQVVNVGLFSYSAPGKSGVIYDSEGPQTGDPIFLKAACDVTVKFDYMLNGDLLSDVQGSILLTAETRTINGWRRTFPLQPVTKFTGNSTQVQASLNPCQILKTLHKAEDQVQVHHDSYQLRIIPTVTISATVGLLPIQSTFSPNLIFYLDDTQMYVIKEGTDSLSAFKAESKVTTAEMPNKIQLPGFTVDVRIARVLSLMGLIFSLGLGLFLGLSIYRAVKQDPILAATLRYGALIVNVSEMPSLTSHEIWVQSVDDLALLAERNATVILHVVGEDADDFIIEGNHVVYRVGLSHRRL